MSRLFKMFLTGLIVAMMTTVSSQGIAQQASST